MRVALYLRVSSPKSKGTQDPENQKLELAKLLAKLREFCKKEEDFNLVKEYVDMASAKGVRNNQQFEKMFSHARHKRFDVVLFWALDRFDRGGTLRYLYQTP